MLTALSLAAALSAQSQTAPRTPPTPDVRTETRVMVLGGPGGHGALDTDGDGQVSREEFAAPMNDAFGRMDANGDGRLSDEEMQAGHPGPGGAGDVVFMRHPGPDGPGAPGMRQVEVRRENVNGEESVRVFTRGENGEMVEVEGGLDGMTLPDGAHIRMLGGDGGNVRIFTRGADGDRTQVTGDGEHEITIIRRGGPGDGAEWRTLPDGPGRVMMFEMDGDGGPGERRFEVRTLDGPGGHGGPGAPHIQMHRIGGPDGPGDMDRDGDGRVTEDEFLAPMREAFRRMDADRSGAIEAGEHGEGGDHRVHVITRPDTPRSGD